MSTCGPDPDFDLASLRCGVAGWAIPRDCSDAFPGNGSHLERYARQLGAVEINSSFYRPHRRSTYERWAASVPAGFRFAVKAPRTITHERRLVGCEALLDEFLGGIAGLGRTLGCVLVQLPPSLAYERARVEAFLGELRARHAGAVALEPRHPSWFEGAASVHLARRRVARVAADPAPGRAGEQPAGDRSLSYFRLHGAPRIYHSDYDGPALASIAARLRAAAAISAATWCIFDNTALGAAPFNALEIQRRLAGCGTRGHLRPPPPSPSPAPSPAHAR